MQTTTMKSTVIIRFNAASEYEFLVDDAALQGRTTRADANQWLKDEYAALECEPRNPVGKILLLDVILDVAKYGGERRFMARDGWAQRYAECCALALERQAILVDVGELSVN